MVKVLKHVMVSYLFPFLQYKKHLIALELPYSSDVINARGQCTLECEYLTLEHVTERLVCRARE